MRLVVFKIIILLLFTNLTKSQNIKVALFYNNPTEEILITPYFGTYSIFINDSLITTASNSFLVKKQGEKIEVKILHDSTYYCNQIYFKSNDTICALRLKKLSPNVIERYYDDDLSLKIINGKMQILNIVNLEKYIGGVVESETGYHNNLEYYKIQTILCRTYTLKNLGKHYEEGFNFCDDVHCQSYKGKNYSKSSNTFISEAITLTHNLVVVDTSLNLIDAVYHANCGGQTMNAQDVWGSSRYYLKSVYDPYCIKKRNSYWKKSVELEEFNKFLKNYYNTSVNNGFEYFQPQRQSFFKINGENISLRKIREYFNLKSTFFNIKINNDSVYFEGKGIGHGVGLCQDGAEQMTLEGFSYRDIINFYYKGIKIIDYHQLPLFKD